MDTVSTSPDIWTPSPTVHGWTSPTTLFWNDAPREDAPGTTTRRFMRLSATGEEIVGQLVVLIDHGRPSGDIELLAWGEGRPLTRGVLRTLVAWIFGDLACRRLVLHIRASDERSQGYARRLGFVHEGRARAYFDDGETASVWAVLASDTPRWFQRLRNLRIANAPSTGTLQ